MNALITGIVAFFLFALGVICPHEFIYVPALLSIIVVGGYVGGTIFSLQSDGVYALHIRAGRATSNASDTRLGGIWAYGLVGVPAGAIALLLIARIAGVDDSAVAAALSEKEGVAGAVRRVAVCLGTFSVTVIGGFLGLNLIRVVSDRVRAEIHRQVSGQVEPLRLLDRGKQQMEEHSYREALETFRSLALHDSTLVPIVWQGRALKRLGKLPEAIDVLTGGLACPVISVSIMALHRQNAELDYDIASVLSEHACRPLDEEIENLASLLASCTTRCRLGEARV
jgi:hypothetical protein